MSTAAIVFEVLDGLVGLARQIRKWISEGLSDEEILKRLADPSGVGADLIRRLRSREDRGRDLLGRDPR